MIQYGKKWRTGANSTTKIGFSTDVNVGGVDVEKGQYALFTEPGATSWMVYLYSDVSGGGVPSEWDDAKVAASFKITPQKTGMSNETMLINFNNLRDNSASIDLCWENTLVSIPVTVPADAMVQESIEKTMAGPSGGDYYSAARYYRESGKDLNKALEWMNKSLEMRGDRFWSLRQKALILADLGKYKDAIAVAKTSMGMAKEAGNDDYIRSNEKSIAAWMKM